MLFTVALAFALQSPPAPATSSSPAVQVELADGALSLSSPFVWKTGSAELTAESQAVVAGVAQFLASKASITTLRIEGHVADGAEAQALSELRAAAVAKALVAAGVDCQRLIVTGFGATKPVAATDTMAGRTANTRITLVPAALRGKAIGGMPTDGGGKVVGSACPVPPTPAPSGW